MSEENLSVVTSEKEPKQDKEALRARWAWVEHRVWTDSMLRSLERGIKGGKWYALIDKVYELKNLQSGFWKVWRNAGSALEGGQLLGGRCRYKIVDATQRGGFEFLGYHFERGQKWPR